MPLASPNKTIYWECLVKLFSVMNHQLSFGVERDVLVQELQYYFEQDQAAAIVDESFDGKSSRDKANWMLRRLEYYGWVEIEYQGYIYTIYSLVRSSTDNPGIVLLSILENTDMLITGLKNLNSGIKRYIDELTKYKTPAEISAEQAEELVYQYIHEIIDAFQNMDDILAEINQKNTQYQKAAINRAKFYLIGGEDVRGQPVCLFWRLSQWSPPRAP